MSEIRGDCPVERVGAGCVSLTPKRPVDYPQGWGGGFEFEDSGED